MTQDQPDRAAYDVYGAPLSFCGGELAVALRLGDAHVLLNLGDRELELGLDEAAELGVALLATASAQRAQLREWGA